MTKPPDAAVLIKYVDHFIIPLLCKVGLKVKVTRKPEYTTLKISLRRAEQAG